MQPILVIVFLSGAFMMACMVAGLFFHRFWVQTKDKFFRSFSYAFCLLAVERMTLLILNSVDEVRTYIYLIRLVAFLLIIFAILRKNSRNSPNEN